MEPITNPLETLPPSLLPPAMGEHCVACGSLLARDQRYCLECGERNGEPRLARMTGRPVVAEAVVPPPPPPHRGPRASAGTTLVAGIGVLLLALGVGVEIGRSSGDNNKAAATPPVRFVMPNGAGTGTAAPTATVSGSTSTGSTATGTTKSAGKGAKSNKSSAGKAAKATPTPVASATPPPTVKLGQKGHGKGYKNGKFTGDFFGG